MVAYAHSVGHSVEVASFNLLMLRLEKVIAGVEDKGELDDNDCRLLEVLIRKLNLMRCMAWMRGMGHYESSTEMRALLPYLHQLKKSWPKENPAVRNQKAADFLSGLVDLCQALLDDNLTPRRLRELQKALSTFDLTVDQHVHQLACA